MTPLSTITPPLISLLCSKVVAGCLRTRKTVLFSCPDRAQHTENSDGTSSTVILRTPAGGQRFKCLHGHCEHLSDRDNLVALLGGPSILAGFAKKRDSSAGSQESAPKETTAPPTTSWLRLDPRSGLFHVRQIEAANAFLETCVQLDDSELEQTAHLSNPPVEKTSAPWAQEHWLMSQTCAPFTGEKSNFVRPVISPWNRFSGFGKTGWPKFTHSRAAGTGKTTIAMQMAALSLRGQLA